jgi:hypothetical protein
MLKFCSISLNLICILTANEEAIMKKLLILFVLLGLSCVQVVMAANLPGAANIHLKIAGATQDNRYFLCIPNVGCMSLLAAEQGRVFSFYSGIRMNTIFIADRDNDFRLYSQGLPTSCQVKVKPNHALQISGQLMTANDNVRINQLHCAVT